jgi:dTDP-4-amino-4,6-dideoxygalactose transaminase
MIEIIPIAEPYILKDDAQAVYDCVLSTWISMGKEVETFEKLFADYVNVNYAIAMNNGTSTLHTSLIAHGIGPGDEVIVPTLTYISSVNVILYVGAKPVLCECNPKTYNIEPEHIESLISDHTKAIMSVDMNGLPVDYDALKELCEKHNLIFIADSAEAAGAKYKNKIVGSQADIHSFSFFPNKNITTGEGGMITTNNKEIADKLKILRNQGQDSRYHHIELGYNYRMTDMQASLGKVQLSRLEWAMERKNEIRAFYDLALRDISGIEIPYVPEYATRPSWYMYTISFDAKIDRDAIKKELMEKGIDTRVSFPPAHIQPYHSNLFESSPDDYPLSYEAWKKLLNLPVGLGLKQSQLEKVVEALKFIL